MCACVLIFDLPMPTTAELEEIRGYTFADDVEITEEMTAWSHEDCVAYFESGGEEAVARAATAAARKAGNLPPVADLASLSMCQTLAPDVAPSESACELESAKSSIDGWVPGGRNNNGTSEAPTVPYADLSANEQQLGVGSDEMGCEMVDEDDEFDTGGEERTEDALLDADPMSSVPVVRIGAAPPESPSAQQEQAQKEEDDGVGGWSVRQLKDFLSARQVDMRALNEKAEYVAEVRRVRAAEATSTPAASSSGTPGTPASARGAEPESEPAEPSARLARLLRKVEDIKRSGDTAFRAKDFEKAERHYTSAIERAKDLEPEERVPPGVLAALHSNRSGTRETLNRHADALIDGREAIRLRKGWARAYCRVGAALISLRRFEEAKDTYEEGLRHEPGSGELQSGLTAVLQKLGKSAGGSAAAAAAKERGNLAFKEGRLEEAVAAYSEAIRAAPTDETLYSNRSATYAKMERYKEALEDGKRAVSLQPKWGKGYSRAGLAALKGSDEEASYWFYANGLRYDPSNTELLRGRDACLQALRAVGTARHQRRLERYNRDKDRPPARVFAVSDVHYDHPGAKEWGQNLSKTAYKNDAIILAGDIGDTYTAVRLALRAFKAAFRRVFYVPGNHDMWIRPKGQHSDEPGMFADSVQKLLSLWQMCDELDVDVGPARLSPRCTVVPLDSWYSFTFDHHDPRPGSTLFDKFCKWPMHYDHTWDFMCGLNEPRLAILQEAGAAGGNGADKPDVITFSHFLPRKELPLPGVHEMAKASGCLKIEDQLRKAGSKLHIFGHTHINTQHEYSGVVYMQNAMGYGIAPGTKLPVVHDKGSFTQYMA